MRLRLGIVLAVAGAFVACKKSPSPVVAKLEQMTAQVERMPRANAAWQGARVGDGFIIGSAVRTGADSTAKLRVGKKGKLEVKPSSVVYFTRNHQRERNDLKVDVGSIELEAGEEAIGFGDAVLEPEGRAQVTAGAEGTTFIVSIGRLVLEDTVISAGESVTLKSAGNVAVAARPDAGVGNGMPTDGKLAIRVRDKAATVTTDAGKSELAIGEHAVGVGARLSIAIGGALELSRGGARGVAHGATELVVGEGSTLVHVGSGHATLTADSSDATATLPGGKVIAKKGGRADITVDAKESNVAALAGDIVVESATGSQTIAAGRTARVLPTGTIELLPPPPDRTVVAMSAGESVTLHDPKAPTPLQVGFDPACGGSGGLLEVSKDRTFKKLVGRSGGATSANVLLAAGSYSYRVRCGDGKLVSGSVRVVTDSGRTPLPKTAARTTVEMDGREYTILYQNILPEVTLSWRNAPRQASYFFVVKPARGTEKRIPNKTATIKLVAGELREGSYKVWVEPAGGPRSEESRIVIEFDNAAASASIDSVEPGADGIRVKGTVIESSAVSAQGTAIALDRHRRFETVLAPRNGEDGAGIRIAHPKGGIHYYVMRAAPP